jgi:integrase
MGLYKRGKIWWVSFMVPGLGQHCQSTGTSNKRLARKILDMRRAEIVEGRFGIPKSNPPTLDAWATQFLESIPHPNTKRTYKSCIQVLNDFFGQVKLSELTLERIEQFKITRSKAGAGPATINRNLAVLRRMLKLAARQRLIARSPFADDSVESLEERKFRRRPRIITFEEEQRILGNARPLLKALIVLLVETGLRVGKEALPLKWADIDFADNVIHVRESKTFAGRRVLPMSSFCVTELLQWKTLMGPDFSPFVFPNPSNPANHLKSVRKPWATALKDAKIDFFRIYDLRANFASRLSASGNSDNLVAGVIGHSTTSIVQTYAKVVDEYRRDAIRKLEAFRQRHLEQGTTSEEHLTKIERPN